MKTPSTPDTFAHQSPTNHFYNLLYEVKLLLDECYSDVYNITRDWGSYDLTSLPQSTWDASKPVFESLSSKLCLNASRLYMLMSDLEDKILFMYNQVEGNLEQKDRLTRALNILYGKAQGVHDKVSLYTCTGSGAPNVDEFFVSANSDICSATVELKYFLAPIVDPLPAEEPAPTTTSTEKSGPTTLIELFKGNEGNAKRCLEVLRRYEVLTIDESANWIGKRGKGSKSVVVAWIDQLENKALIESTGDRSNLIPILEKYFPGLSISRSAFYSSRKADEDKKLKDYFTAAIPF